MAKDRSQKDSTIEDFTRYLRVIDGRPAMVFPDNSGDALVRYLGTPRALRIPILSSDGNCDFLEDDGVIRGVEGLRVTRHAGAA